METEVLLNECRKCSAPLGHSSKMEGFHLCPTCRYCVVCNHSLSATETRIPFPSNSDGKPFVSHIHCSPFNASRMIPESTVTITQTHLDYLNAFRLCLEPQVEFSLETNRQNSTLASRKLISEMSSDTLLLFVARIETLMADVSVALSKNMVRVRAVQSKRDADRNDEVNAVRNQPVTPKVVTKKLNREANAAKVFESVLGKDMALQFQLALAAKLKTPAEGNGE